MASDGAPRVAIIGAGPAGARAAAVLVRAGLRPTVIDEAPASGGQIFRRPPPGFARSPRDLYGFDAGAAAGAHAEFDALAGKIDHRPSTAAWAVEPERLHVVDAAGRIAALAWDALLLATGAMDRVIPFPGWTLPGVYTLGGAQIALKHQGCAIGRRVAFIGSSPLLYRVAYQYAKAGAEVAAVLDTAPPAEKAAALPGLIWGGATFAKGLYFAGWLAARGVPLAHGATPLGVEGGEHVEALAWRTRGGRERRIACDALAIGWGLRSETQLADLAGVPLVFHAGQRQWLPQADAGGRTQVRGVYVCGDGAGIAGAGAALLSGERAALALLADLGMEADQERIAAIARSQARLARFRLGLEKAFPFPAGLAGIIADGTTVCRCEGIAAGEIRRWVRDLGAGEINRAKAFSRVGMGRCQGRVCGGAAAEIVARECGLGVEQVGRLRAQPPVKPLPLHAAVGGSTP
jgi:NADPH-dependent 2,4-dienoyl-CoA reductase/sulfur reductase-like enzyme